MCLIKQGLVDPSDFVCDYITGAKVIHYAGHFGKIKALKTLIEEFKMDAKLKDGYDLNVAHYAARQGELPALLYLREKDAECFF